MNENLELLLENQTLRKEFALRNLNLSDVFTPDPDNLQRENNILKNLLDWAIKYSECKDREKMESEGYEFPPIDYCISPDNDWYIFERWMNGLPVHLKFKDLLPKKFKVKKSEELNDEEIIVELQKLINTFKELGSSIELNDGIPARIVYQYLLETLEEENEIIIEGTWTLDGCSGTCPDCFQRPWCEQGGNSCWTEDETAGKMYLIDSVKKYVSASPVSFQILKFNEAEEKKKFKNFETNPDDYDKYTDDDSCYNGDDYGLPF